MKSILKVTLIMIPVIALFFLTINAGENNSANIAVGEIIEVLKPNGEKLFQFTWGEDGLDELYEKLLNFKNRKLKGVYVVKYKDKDGKQKIRLFRFKKGKPNLDRNLFIDPDVTAPTIRITSGPTTDIVTNTAFSIVFSVNEDFGYVSINNGTDYTRFAKGNKTFDIGETGVVKYYGGDDSGNIGETNSFAVVFNSAPIAIFTINPTSGNTNTLFSLNASNSSDPDGNVIKYSWDLDNNGTYEVTNQTSNNYSINYNSIGSKTIGLMVMDTGGLIGTISKVITVTNIINTNSPNVTIVSGPGSSITTNQSFVVQLAVNKSNGYWTTNNWGQANQFASNVTNSITISKTTTMAFYGYDGLNTSSTNSVIYTFDTTPPVITITTGPTNNITTNQAFSVQLTSDENSGYWTTNNWMQTNQITGNTTNTITILNSRALVFYGYDGLNTSSTNNVTFTFDTAAPTVTITTGPTNSVTTNQAFNVQLTSDENSGYWTTNSWVGSTSFVAGTSGLINISKTTTLAFYGFDALNTSSTNSVTYTNVPWTILSIAGSIHSLILTSNNGLWACGNNSNGQLGDGTTNQRNTLVQIFSSGVSQVSAGERHSLIVKTNGSLWAWGGNSNGQLGDGTTNQRNTPVQIFSSGVSQVSAGRYHTLIVKTDGSLWACGNNSNGQLGDGTTNQRNTPVQIFSSGVSQVSAGAYHSLILKTNESLWACGENFFGQLGDGTTSNRITPVQIFSSGVSQVSVGEYHNLIIKTNGSLWACGGNWNGQIGDGTTTQRNTPIQIFSSGVSRVSGYYHTLIVKTDGSLWACGGNWVGQLGDGTTTQRTVPIQIFSSGIRQASAGELHSLIVKTDYSLWACGENNSGQLGDGTTTQRNTHVLIDNF